MEFSLHSLDVAHLWAALASCTIRFSFIETQNLAGVLPLDGHIMLTPLFLNAPYDIISYLKITFYVVLLSAISFVHCNDCFL